MIALRVVCDTGALCWEFGEAYILRYPPCIWSPCFVYILHVAARVPNSTYLLSDLYFQVKVLFCLISVEPWIDHVRTAL